MPEKEVRLIDAELYRKALKSEMFQKDGEDRLDIQRAIILLDQTPSIYPERLRAKGKWVGEACNHKPYRIKNPEKWLVYHCSVCGYSNGRKKSNYCPNCGAKMDSEETDPFYNKANQNRLNKTIEAYERESWLNWHETKED